MKASVSLRAAQGADLPSIQTIYAHHVRHGLGSFEEIPPSVEEIARRFGELKARNMPYLVAERGGRIMGYAYAGPYRPRAAYRYSVEDSIYVAHDAVGHGIGGALLGELIGQCTMLGYRQMIAVIGDSGNLGSIELHRSFGFLDAGLLRSVGFKFGRWVDSVTMQRPLGPGDSELPA